MSRVNDVFKTNLTKEECITQRYRVRVYQIWEQKGILCMLPFANCTHPGWGCRCQERAMLNQVLDCTREGQVLFTKKELREWIINEYAISGWEEDNFFILKKLKVNKLCSI